MTVEKVLNWYNLSRGAAVVLLTGIFGKYYYIWLALLALQVIDWITGTENAKVHNSVTSEAGYRGAWKKVSCWLMIATAFILANTLVMLAEDVFHQDWKALFLLGWFVTASLLVNECRSIVENLHDAGHYIPPVLLKGLKVADHLVEQVSNMPDIEDDESEENNESE